MFLSHLLLSICYVLLSLLTDASFVFFSYRIRILSWFNGFVVVVVVVCFHLGWLQDSICSASTNKHIRCSTTCVTSLFAKNPVWIIRSFNLIFFHHVLLLVVVAVVQSFGMVLFFSGLFSSSFFVLHEFPEHSFAIKAYIVLDVLLQFTFANERPRCFIQFVHFSVMQYLMHRGGILSCITTSYLLKAMEIAK